MSPSGAPDDPCGRRKLVSGRGRDHEGLYLDAAAGATPASRIRCTDRELLVRHHRDTGKIRHFLPGLALDAMARGGRPRWKHYLGRELYYLRCFRSAIPVLAEHAAATSAWSAERSQSLSFIGECLEAVGQPDEAARSYLQAMTVDPGRREPLLRLAALRTRQGEFEAAATHATQAIAIPRTSAYPELDANYTFVPHALLYWSLFWLGRSEEAREHWELCRRMAPAATEFQGHARLFSSTAMEGSSLA